jgi:Thioesterase superfamily
MEGFSFATEVRVRFAETDAQGIVHNSNYFVWFEVARVEYLERYAGGYQKLRDLGVEAVVLETHIRYLEPARFDERLRVCDRARRRRDRRRVDGARDRGCADYAPDAGAVVVAGGDCFGGVFVFVFGFAGGFGGPTRMTLGSAR